VCIILQSLFSTVIILLIPLPTDSNVPSDFNLIFRGVMTGFSLFFLGIGVWWLVLFTRGGVRAQFQSAPPVVSEGFENPLPVPMSTPPQPRAGRVPVIAIVAAALMLAGTPSMLFVLFLPFPAFLMGRVFFGGAGKLVYILFCLIELTLGIGLLRLKSWSLPATIAFYIFGLLNAVPLLFSSTRDAYVSAVFRVMPFPMPQSQFQLPPHLLAFSMEFGFAFGMAFSLVLIVLLVRSRPAFRQAVRERAATVS
jgi:predicted secreted protein